jgi:NAD(P)-dependent dehydrogenase (short-subunit alcohol dehydrogenase family)
MPRQIGARLASRQVSLIAPRPRGAPAPHSKGRTRRKGDVRQLQLEGQRALITAGAGGIGRVMTETFVAAGARVHICDIDQWSLDETVLAVNGVTASLCDVSDTEQVSRLFADVETQLGGLDVLVNNAGIAGPTARVEEIAIEDWKRCIDVDLNGMFYCTRLAVPMLKAAGGGCVINLSSVAGRLGFPLRTPYAAAKWAVVGFTKSLSMELGGDGIRVNAIQPGVVEGQRIDGVIQARATTLGTTVEEERARLLANVSLHSTVSAQEIADLALYLASDLGLHVTGQALSLCAGVETLG